MNGEMKRPKAAHATVQSKSAASDRNDDLQLIAGSQVGSSVLTLGHAFAIAFNGNTLARVAKLFDQDGHGQRFGKLAVFAIDLEGKHGAILASRAASSV